MANSSSAASDLRRRGLTAAVLLVLGHLAPAAAQVNGTLAVNATRLQGTHPGGSLLLYSPDPLELGSSTSHWDTTATPNLLMEPFVTEDLTFLGLDITPAQMADVFWPLGTLSINVFDLDPAGVGFTDPTPFAGAPGNPAATLGEARINLFIAVLGAWANTLSSDISVDILVSWQPQFCQPGVGAIIAGASTTFIIALEGGTLPGPTLFHAALAESLIGADLTGPPGSGGGDLIVFMNSAIDTECLGPGSGFYYGLDGNNPPNLIDAAGTVLHEVGHGLGFSNFVNEETGQQTGGLPGIYDLWTLDNSTGKFWDQMTDAERVQSATNFGQVTWQGPMANAVAAATLDTGVPELTVNSPAPIAGIYGIGGATFGPPIPGGGGLTADIACLRDSTADGSDFNGCTTALNPGDLAGKIALISRGGCLFTTKAANAQAAGAVGAIIANNAGDSFFTMGGTDPAIAIPSAMLGQGDGSILRGEACPCPDILNLFNTVIAGDQTLRAGNQALLGPNLVIDGTALRIVTGTAAQLFNDVEVGGTFSVEIAADGCATP